MKRYVGKFINPAGQSCRVNVYDDNYTGEAVELFMSPTPIVISESAQDLLTEPIMASSAVLTFISDPALEGLVVEDEMQCAVEVLADDTLVWHGYLNPEVRDDLLPSITSEVTLNATSTLSLMSTRKISAAAEPLRSIAQYIAEGLQACGNVLTNICLPSVAKLTENDGYNSLWTLQAQRDNFYTREEITSTDDELYDEQSWADVLSNFLTLFGLTMYEDYASGCIMLLSRDADATYCRMTLADFAAGTGAESYALPDSADMASLPMWGTSHSTSNYRPYSSVKVTSQVNAVEDTLFSLDNAVGAPAFNGFYRVGIGGTTDSPSVRELCSGGVRQLCPELRTFKPQADTATYKRIETFKGVEALDINYLVLPGGGLPGYLDAWLLGAIPIKGGIGISNIAVQETSFDPDFNPMILVRRSVDWPQNAALPTDKVLLPSGTDIVRLSNTYAYGQNWGLSIDLELQDWYTWANMGAFTMPLEIVLKAGKYYWNGSEWQTDEVSFVPEMETGEVQTLKSKDQCQDVKYYSNLIGTLITRNSTDTAVSDDPCLGLSLTLRLRKEWCDKNPIGFLIKKLDVKISPYLRTADRDAFTGDVKNVYVYRKTEREKADNPLEIDLNVQGYHGELLAKSCLLSPSGETITGLDYGEKLEIPEIGTVSIISAPEDWLINHLKGIYCRRRKRYKLTVEGIDYKTNTRYSYEGITYTTVARSVDPYNNTTTLTLERATKSANL